MKLRKDRSSLLKHIGIPTLGLVVAACSATEAPDFSTQPTRPEKDVGASEGGQGAVNEGKGGGGGGGAGGSSGSGQSSNGGAGGTSVEQASAGSSMGIGGFDDDEDDDLQAARRSVRPRAHRCYRR